jgi:hypothetical protein
MKRHPKRETTSIVDRSDFTVSLATLQAAPKARPKQRPIDFAARFAIEKALQQRRYCDAFALWRSCPHKECRRRCRCVGDAAACLRQAVPRVPHEQQWHVRQDMLDATPRNIGAPERKARQLMPIDFYA